MKNIFSPSFEHTAQVVYWLCIKRQKKTPRFVCLAIIKNPFPETDFRFMCRLINTMHQNVQRSNDVDRLQAFIPE